MKETIRSRNYAFDILINSIVNYVLPHRWQSNDFPLKEHKRMEKYKSRIVFWTWRNIFTDKMSLSTSTDRMSQISCPFRIRKYYDIQILMKYHLDSQLWAFRINIKNDNHNRIYIGN